MQWGLPRIANSEVNSDTSRSSSLAVTQGAAICVYYDCLGSRGHACLGFLCSLLRQSLRRFCLPIFDLFPSILLGSCILSDGFSTSFNELLSLCSGSKSLKLRALYICYLLLSFTPLCVYTWDSASGNPVEFLSLCLAFCTPRGTADIFAGREVLCIFLGEERFNFRK